MSEELQKKFFEYLGKIESGISKGVDVATETLPKIAQDFVEFRIAVEGIYLLLFIVLVAVGLFVIKKLINLISTALDAGKGERETEFGFSLVGLVFSVIFTGIFTSNAISTAVDFVHVLKSPTTYLIVESKEIFGSKKCGSKK